MRDIDYNLIDKDIRKTVKFLRDHGFDTCDSGDGYSKFEVDPGAEALDYPHVFIQVSDPITLTAHADRLARLLKDHGIPIDDIGHDPAPNIHATYDPANSVAIIMLSNVDDILLLDILP